MRIKEAVVKAPVLKYFKESHPTECQGDASQSGVGFVVMQCRQPVTFSSRALTPAERRYSQIEKELLPHGFGMEHNHNYDYGRKVILWTNHKLLVSISKKPLVSVPKRLQRLLLRVQQYDYEICYKPGKDMELADTLSRAYLTEYERSAPEVEVEHIHATHFLPVPEHQLKELQETACDQTLQTLNKALVDGFPNTKQELSAAIHLYFQLPYELSIHDGIIFKGLRCVIPQTNQGSKRNYMSHILACKVAQEEREK